MIEIVADACGDENAQVLSAHVIPQLTELYHTVHHLSHAETVAEVVERVVPVVLLNAQLKKGERANISEPKCRTEGEATCKVAWAG